MTRYNKKDDPTRAMDNQTGGLIGAALNPVSLPASAKNRIKNQLMERIKKNAGSIDHGYLTIAADQGSWETLAPGLEKKVLHLDTATNKESFLVRIQPGCDVPGHTHDQDELCMMLEGDVSLGNIHLKAGDFHLARSGSSHGNVRSTSGALLFIQAAA